MTLMVAIALVAVVVALIALVVWRTRRPAPEIVSVARPIIEAEDISTTGPVVALTKADATEPVEEQPEPESVLDVHPPAEAQAAVDAQSAPESEPESEPQREPEPESEPEPVITWTAALTPAVLDEAARLRLIDDLALLASPWSIELLRRAFDEETSLLVSGRIEAALASNGERASR